MLRNRKPAVADHAVGPCRVLIVDDDPLVCTRLCMLLKAAKYQVEVAATGKEALRILESGHCHIVLTDWEMPDMDGLALCRHLRLQSRDSYVYILMLTIRDSAPDLLSGLAAGADDYVVKGAPVDEILARLEVGRRISHGESRAQNLFRAGSEATGLDQASGAHNHEYLLQHLPREWARSQRYGHCLGALMCRIDGFQQFTDRFGHEAGNQQLRAFVSAAATSIRRSDWLARSLHDSFIVMLPETKMAGVHRAARKLSALFAVHPLSTPAAPVGFTVTVHAASFDGKHAAHGGAQIDALLRQAASGNCRKDLN